jgi:hypothetical protein
LACFLILPVVDNVAELIPVQVLLCLRAIRLENSFVLPERMIYAISREEIGNTGQWA